MKRRTSHSILSLSIVIVLLTLSSPAINAAKLPQKTANNAITANEEISSILAPLLKNSAHKRTDLDKMILSRMLEELDHSGNSYIIEIGKDTDKITPAITVRLRNGVPTVTAVQVASDGWRKNIRSGDLILEIDGKSCAGSTMSMVNSLLKGEKDSKVKIKLLRKAADKIYKVTLKREVLEGQVFVKALADQLLYIKPTLLDSNTVKMIPASLPKTNGHTIGAILDLRGTEGGGIKEATLLGKFFLKKGTLVQVVNNKNSKKSIKVQSKKASNTRLVILVDEGTGKAGEIIAATLQEQHRAVVMGKTTCGLGAIYHNVNSKLYGKIRLPESLLLTAKGEPLFNNGITPDIPAEYAASGVREWGKFRHEVLAMLNDVKPDDLEWPGKEEKKEDDSSALIDELTKDETEDGKSDSKNDEKDKKEDKSEQPKTEKKEDDKKKKKDEVEQKDSIEEQILENYALVRQFDRPFVRALNLLVSMNIFFSETSK